MNKRLYIPILLIAIVGIVLVSTMASSYTPESTTSNLLVIEKDKSDDEQWIILENNVTVYVKDHNTWVLIEENHKYTLIYDFHKRTKKYYLRTIIPSDYKEQF